MPRQSRCPSARQTAPGLPCTFYLSQFEVHMPTACVLPAQRGSGGTACWAHSSRLLRMISLVITGNGGGQPTCCTPAAVMSIEQIASKTGLVHFTYPARFLPFIFGRSYPFGYVPNADLPQTFRYIRSAKKDKTNSGINNLTWGRLGKAVEKPKESERSLGNLGKAKVKPKASWGKSRESKRSTGKLGES